MESIKFIRGIMKCGKRNDGKEVGDALYFVFANGNRAKVYVSGGHKYGESHGITVDIVNKIEGEVDTAYFPFENYFKPTQCSPSSPLWYQYIQDGRWHNSQMYTHVLPTKSDFKKIADAVCDYMEFFS